MGEIYMSGGRRGEAAALKRYAAIEARKGKPGHGIMPKPNQNVPRLLDQLDGRIFQSLAIRQRKIGVVGVEEVNLNKIQKFMSLPKPASFWKIGRTEPLNLPRDLVLAIYCLTV
jgi:hypothetical protein